MGNVTNREITLTLAAQSTGADSIRSLAEQFRLLSKEGGDASPKFDKLGKELDDLAKQADLLAAFDDLNAKVSASKTALDTATAAVKRHELALAEKRQALAAAQQTEQQTAATMSQFQAALENATIGYRRARAEVDAWKAAIRQTGAATEEQEAGLRAAATTLAEYRAKVSAAKAEIAALAPAHGQFTEAAKAAAAAAAAEAKALNTAADAAKEADEAHDALGKTSAKVTAAMKRLGLDTTDLAAVQARLAAAMSRIEGEGRRMQRALDESGGAAGNASRRIEDAFAVIGVRSVASVKAQILALNNALMVLAKESGVSGAEFDRAFTAARTKIAQLEASLNNTTNATSRVRGVAAGAATAFTNMGAALASAFSAKKFMDANVAMDSSERALRLLTGSAAAAAKEMGYLKDVSQRLGLDVKTTAEQYTGLIAAAKSTTLTQQQVRAAFEAVAGSMSILGRSSMDTENALRAVQQMMTKGVVSMEELRQQLGEKLPLALQGTAEGLGITTEELIELVSAGKLTADIVIPALTKSLDNLYKTSSRVETFQAGLARATNMVTEAFVQLGQSGVMDAIVGGFQVLGATVAATSAALVAAGRTIGTTFAFMKNVVIDLENGAVAFSRFKNEVSDISAELEAKSAKIDASLARNTKGANTAAEAMLDLGNGVQVAASRVGEGAPAFVRLTKDLLVAQGVTEKHAAAMALLTDAAKKQGEGLIASANALGDETDKRKAAAAAAELVRVAAEKEVYALGKAIQTRQAEVDLRKQQIRIGAQTEASQQKILRDLELETEKLEAAMATKKELIETSRITAKALSVEAAASQDNSTRVEELRSKYIEASKAVEFYTDAQKNGLEVSGVLKHAIEEQAAAGKLHTDAVRDQATAMREVAALSGDEREQRKANLDAALLQLQALRDLGKGRSDEARNLELSVAKLEVERKAYEDNSASLSQLKYAYAATRAEIEQLRAAKAQGVDVTDKLRDAELRGAKASALYRDAVKDQVSAIQAQAQVKQASIVYDQALVRSQIETLKNSAAMAMAAGDEAKAISALNKIKQLEIQLAELTADAKRAEADAALALVEAKREELRTTKQLTPEKEAELRAAELSAKAKSVEADISRETAKGMRELLEAHNKGVDGMNASTSAAEANASALDGIGRAARGAADGVDQLTAAERKQGLVKRQVSTSTIDHAALARSLGLTSDEDIATFSESFGKRAQTETSATITRLKAQPLISSESFQALYAGAMKTAQDAALNDVRIARGAPTKDSQQKVTSAQPAQAQTGATDYSVHTVRIELPGGGQGSVNMASKQDATNLVGVLSQLGTDMKRAK